jgi:predicted Zn-dependent protease
MEVRAVRDWFVRSAAELPSDQALLEAARSLAGRLAALVKAPPLAEDYQGPVLFSSQAACVFFLKAIGDPLSHAREPLGMPHPGRLTERLGKHVASKGVTAKDDPTQLSWRGQPLLGYFPVDDDGVKPEPITLVDQGVLKTYYMSRVPTLKVPKTNGHSRAGEGSVGSLFVETPSPQSNDALKRQLLELVKEEDLEFGVRVEQLEDSAAFRGGSPSISLPAPLVAYRVYPDGREELIRGATFKPAPFRTLKDIAGLGDTQQLLNTYQGSQRVSVVAPAVLVKNLELQKPREEFEKPPVIPRPKLARQ